MNMIYKITMRRIFKLAIDEYLNAVNCDN